MNNDEIAALEQALSGGMDPLTVFKTVLQNVYGERERKELVIGLGALMGLEPSESLRIARRQQLASSVRIPRKLKRGMPLHKSADNASEKT